MPFMDRSSPQADRRDLRFANQTQLRHRGSMIPGRAKNGGRPGVVPTWQAIVQDVDAAVEHAPAFLDFFQREIGLAPVWIWPFSAHDLQHRFPVFPTDPKALYINFGFWNSKVSQMSFPEGHFNRLIENKVAELGGIKSLYSDSYFTPEDFRAACNRQAYDKLKSQIRPKGPALRPLSKMRIAAVRN